MCLYGHVRLSNWFKQEFIPVPNKDTMKTSGVHQQAYELYTRELIIIQIC